MSENNGQKVRYSEPPFRERAARALRLLDGEHGADPETWKETLPIVDLLLKTIELSLLAGKPVMIPGVGTLKSKVKRRRITAPGANRGKAIEERVVTLSGGAVLSAGEPYEI